MDQESSDTYSNLFEDIQNKLKSLNFQSIEEAKGLELFQEDMDSPTR